MSVKTANRDIKSLQPIAQEACNLFLSECKKQGVPIFITETHRSQQRQAYLYEQGRTRPGNKVTWTLKSNHTPGFAWDIAVSPPNKLYDASIIAKAGAIAGKLGIEWGGTWKTKDTPHFQINNSWKAPNKTVAKATNTNNKTKFNFNGKVFTIDGFVKNGKTHVIARELLESLGLRVGWDNTKKLVTVDGKAIDFEKVIIDGKTYAVARPLLEKLGFRVGFDAPSKTVTVVKQ